MEARFKGVSKVDSWIERLIRCEYLSETEVQELCEMVSIVVQTFFYNFFIISILNFPIYIGSF